MLCSVRKASVGNKSMVHQVAEFIAHYRTIGARHFYFYDLEMSDDLRALIARIQWAGVDVRVMPFKLPVPKEQVYQNGQREALHECILRSVLTSEWFLNVDLDELMLPITSTNLQAQIETVQPKKNDCSVDVILVLNRRFCFDYGARASSIRKGDLPLMTRLYSHYAGTANSGAWAKYMARGRSVMKADIHFLWETGSNSEVIEKKPEEIVVNHYTFCCHLSRSFDYGVVPWREDLLYTDRRIRRYSKMAEKDIALATLEHVV
ncbi:hypothetical protein HPB48_017789 [Haemaphysalis longicornis]|uniref:Glycosyltransferase family 92 protein n=1 Tax=Haemaphysalis longicornis TaxID=44386 RepID=A0A9J6FVR2_HAELO|nr:hypothetical protein HPB48_017789 [Haemaphysalis longicornis]